MYPIKSAAISWSYRFIDRSFDIQYFDENTLQMIHTEILKLVMV